MTTTADRRHAAERLSVDPAEIADVGDSPAGLLITTTDGQVYVDVPADRPDAAGRHGVMLLQAPRPNWGGTFPVYSQPGAPGEPPSPPAGAARADVGPGLEVELGDGTSATDANDVPGAIDDVKAWVRDDADRARSALAVEQGRGRPRPSLVAWLGDRVQAP